MQAIPVLNISFDFDYLPLFIIAALAWVIPMLTSFARLSKIPTAVLEIILGYVIARPLLSNFSVESIRILEFLALTGFIFLMFLTGLEIDVNKILDSMSLKKMSVSRFRRNPFLVGMLIFLLTLALSFLFSKALSHLVEIKSIWYFSLILVTSSVGIILPVLKRREEINTEFGQMIISAAAIADIISIILFTLTAFIIKNGFRPEVFLIIALFILFYIFYRIGLRLKDFRIFKKITYQLAHADLQIRIRGTVFLILVFIISSQFIDKEAILLGAFLAGVLLSVFLYKSRSLLLIKLDGMSYGFFIPIFFIMIGAQFNASYLKELDNSLLPFLGFLLLILYLVKIIPSFVWLKHFGIRKVFSGGVILASRLSLIIAASKIGLDLEIITPGVNVVLTDSDEDNIKISRLLREEFGHEKIISRAGTSRIELELLRLGVDIIDTPRVIATTVENLILRPTTYEALIETFESFTVEEITITNKKIDRIQVKEIPFHTDGFLMLIRRGKEMHVPHGDTQLRSGDKAIIFGTNKALDDFRDRMT